MTKRAALTNPIGLLANEQSVANTDGALGAIVNQVAYTGITVAVAELRAALTEQAEVCPSTFSVQPVLSLHYGCQSMEFRIRQPEAVRASRLGIEALYRETDRLPRTQDAGGLELFRPNAFARCMGHLRVRWAQGNFSVPRPSTIRGWWTAEQQAMLAA